VAGSGWQAAIYVSDPAQQSAPRIAPCPRGSSVHQPGSPETPSQEAGPRVVLGVFTRILRKRHQLYQMLYQLYQMLYQLHQMLYQLRRTVPRTLLFGLGSSPLHQICSCLRRGFCLGSAIREGRWRGCRSGTRPCSRVLALSLCFMVPQRRLSLMCRPWWHWESTALRWHGSCMSGSKHCGYGRQVKSI
jgi:hypothetical protein